MDNRDLAEKVIARLIDLGYIEYIDRWRCENFVENIIDEETNGRVEGK